MTTARKQVTSLIDTPYYHGISHCVRRAFLCGVDKDTGASYQHRRVCIEKRLFKLAQVFAIQICTHAVIHNHLHVVV